MIMIKPLRPSYLILRICGLGDSQRKKGVTMKVYVVFDFPEITDVNSPEADWAIDSLSEDLTGFARDGEYEWYIDDAEGATNG